MSKISRGGTERARQWRRRLDQWERSGLSQAAFCRRHGLKAVTFGWWKRKLGAAAASSQARGKGGRRASSGPGRGGTRDANFVEVAMARAGTAAFEVVLSRDVVIRLPADFDPDKVSQLVAAVKAAC